MSADSSASQFIFLRTLPHCMYPSSPTPERASSVDPFYPANQNTLKLFPILPQPQGKGFSPLMVVLVLSHFSRVQLFVTLWTAARQAPLSVGFSTQEYWSGLPCPLPGDLPNPGIEPTSRVLQVDGKPLFYICVQAKLHQLCPTLWNTMDCVYFIYSSVYM